MDQEFDDLKIANIIYANVSSEFVILCELIISGEKDMDWFSNFCISSSKRWIFVHGIEPTEHNIKISEDYTREICKILSRRFSDRIKG